MLHCNHTLVFLGISYESSIIPVKQNDCSVIHISDELEPNKVVCYEKIGTYVRLHVLFTTNYVKYIRISQRVYDQIDHTLSCTI